ncbi:MAG: TIGR01777 family oxidoreductase [Bacteroidota bacterium]
MKVLIAGGTGFIGTALIEALANKGANITLLSRKASIQTNSHIETIKWDGMKVPAFDKVFDVAINLSGAPIASEKWTPKYKDLLISSRVNSTKAMVEFVNNQVNKELVFVNASAIGIYGDRADEVLDENSSAGRDFVSQLGVKWEQEASKANVRTLMIRTGIVLSSKGGALPSILKSIQLGVASYFGNGKQYFSWIHIDDLVGAMLFLIENKDAKGAFNMVSPNPIFYKDFVKRIKAIKYIFFLLPLPFFIPKILLGQRSFLILQSQRVIPAKLTNLCYQFKFSTLIEALKNI